MQWEESEWQKQHLARDVSGVLKVLFGRWQESKTRLSAIWAERWQIRHMKTCVLIGLGMQRLFKSTTTLRKFLTKICCASFLRFTTQRNSTGRGPIMENSTV